MSIGQTGRKAHACLALSVLPLALFDHSPERRGRPADMALALFSSLVSGKTRAQQRGHLRLRERGALADLMESMGTHAQSHPPIPATNAPP